MLSILVLIPLLGSIVVLAMPDNTPARIQAVKVVSLWIAMGTCVIAFLIWGMYDEAVIGYQITSYSDYGFCAMHIGVDGLSVYYVLLTAILTPICMLASWSNVTHSVRLYFVMQLITCAVLLCVFIQIDLLLFYVSFEAVLVPLFFIVGRWGGSPSRTRSAILLFLYTLAGSLFMLLAIVGLYAHTGTLDLTVLHGITISDDVQRVLWVSFALAMAVKTPVVPVHVWLPRAHADAPLAGSMVLAGTVLKLASYGVLRVMLPVLPSATYYYTPLVYTVAIVSLVYASLATLRQSDFKALVAYSSIAHMAVVLLGMHSNSVLGITGAVMLSLAHGFVSPALFMLVGGVLYDRYHSRELRYYRGLAIAMPVFSVILFIATCANMGVPMTLNWLGEWIALAGTFQYSIIAGSLGALGIVLSACYSVWLYARLCTGSFAPHLSYTIDVTRREMAVLSILLAMPILLGIAPSLIMDVIAYAATTLIYLRLNKFLISLRINKFLISLRLNKILDPLRAWQELNL